MKLNRRTDYALRTLLYLALIKGRLVTLDEIAQKFLIARDHLVKIVNKLAKLHYVVTVRGKKGGIRLDECALEVSLYEIVQHFEASLNMVDCDVPPCPVKGVCRLNLILEEASSAFIEVLKQYQLKDILPRLGNERRQVYKKLAIPVEIEI